MKKAICLFAAIFAISLIAPNSLSAKEKAPEVSEVSVFGEGTGNGGRVMLAVTLAAKKTDKITDVDFKNSAIRCVLFRGWTDKSRQSSFDNSVSHNPIAGNADAQAKNQDYFNDFYSSGEAANYVDLVPDTRKVMKNGKLYNVTQTVTVNVSQLRKKLERDGIIKGLKRNW